MSRCEICGKTVNFGKKVSITRSHVSRRTNHMQKPNVKNTRVNLNGVVKSMNVCTKCIRSNRVTKIRN